MQLDLCKMMEVSLSNGGSNTESVRLFQYVWDVLSMLCRGAVLPDPLIWELLPPFPRSYHAGPCSSCAMMVETQPM